MDNSNIIKALVQEKKALQKRLEAINAALVGFGVSSDTEFNLVSKGIEEKKADNSDGNSEEKDYNKIFIPDEYTPFTSWQEKIAFVLKDKKSGAVADEIAGEIFKLDSELDDTDYVNRSVTQHASKMYRNGEINAVRVGRKFRYKLKELKEA